MLQSGVILYNLPHKGTIKGTQMNVILFLTCEVIPTNFLSICLEFCFRFRRLSMSFDLSPLAIILSFIIAYFYKNFLKFLRTR